MYIGNIKFFYEFILLNLNIKIFIYKFIKTKL